MSNRTIKFTDEQKKAICDLYATGIGAKEVGVAFGVSDGPVRRVLKEFGSGPRTVRQAKLLDYHSAEVISGNLPTERTCTKCGATKPLQAFSPNKKRLLGCDSRCRECRLDYQRTPAQVESSARGYAAWYAKNREYKIAVNSTPARSAKAKEWYHNNIERARETRRRWEKNNPEKAADKRKSGRAKRKVHESAALGKFTVAEWRALCSRYGNRCLRCNESKKLTADHVIPISRGGSNYISNIQPLCLSCNSSKNTDSTDYRTYYSISLAR